MLNALTLENLSASTTAPILLAPLQSQTNALGSTVYLVANVAGSELAYRWQKENAGVYGDLTDGGHIAGAASSILTISNLGSAETGNYRLVVTNSAGTVTGTAFVALPVIQPSPIGWAVSGGQLTMSWTAGQLESTTALNGTNTIWTLVATVGNSLTIPLGATSGNTFYRLTSGQ